MSALSPNELFGISSVIAIPVETSLGVAVDYPTPVVMYAVQDFSFPLKWDHKQMFSSNGQFSIEVGRGKATATLSFSVGKVYAKMFRDAVLDQADLSGKTMVTEVSATTTTINEAYVASPPNDGVFLSSLSVRDSSGNIITRTTDPTPNPDNEYYVDETTGTYTFGLAGTYIINYAYTVPVVGKHINLINTQMGSISTVRIMAVSTFQGKQMLLDFPRCKISSSMDLSLKMDDFSYPKLEFIVEGNDEKSALAYIYSNGIGSAIPSADGLIIGGKTSNLIDANSRWSNTIEQFNSASDLISSFSSTLSSRRSYGSAIVNPTNKTTYYAGGENFLTNLTQIKSDVDKINPTTRTLFTTTSLLDITTGASPFNNALDGSLGRGFNISGLNNFSSTSSNKSTKLDFNTDTFSPTIGAMGTTSSYNAFTQSATKGYLYGGINSTTTIEGAGVGQTNTFRYFNISAETMVASGTPITTSSSYQMACTNSGGGVANIFGGVNGDQDRYTHTFSSDVFSASSAVLGYQTRAASVIRNPSNNTAYLIGGWSGAVLYSFTVSFHMGTASYNTHSATLSAAKYGASGASLL